jgi:hypothetical protein
MPGWRTWVGYAVEGILNDQARQQQAARAPRPVPPKVGAPGGNAAPRLDPIERQITEAEAEFKRTGRMQDLTRVESLKRQRRFATQSRAVAR